MENLIYKKIKFTDLAFYLKLKSRYFREFYKAPKIKDYLVYFVCLIVGYISDIYKDIYNIYIFKDNKGQKIGMIHLSNLHLFKIRGSYKTNKKKYLELYSVDNRYIGKKYGSSIIRITQEKIYPDSKIYGIIKKTNEKALFSASRTGRKEYSSIYKYNYILDKIQEINGHIADSKNIKMREYINGIDEKNIYRIYKNAIPEKIRKIESNAPEDYYVRPIDRVIPKLHKRLAKINEDIFIIEKLKKPVIAIGIKVIKKTKKAEFKIIGNISSDEMIKYIMESFIEKYKLREDKYNIEVICQKENDSIVKNLEKIGAKIIEEYKMVCNYERFL